MCFFAGDVRWCSTLPYYIYFVWFFPHNFILSGSCQFLHYRHHLWIRQLHIASRRLRQGRFCKSRACVYVRLCSSPSFLFALVCFHSFYFPAMLSLAQTEKEMHIAISWFPYMRCNNNSRREIQKVFRLHRNQLS